MPGSGYTQRSGSIIDSSSAGISVGWFALASMPQEAHSADYQVKLCYRTPEGLRAFRIRFFVEVGDVYDATQKDVQLQFGDGSALRLKPGVAVAAAGEDKDAPQRTRRLVVDYDHLYVRIDPSLLGKKFQADTHSLRLAAARDKRAEDAWKRLARQARGPVAASSSPRKKRKPGPPAGRAYLRSDAEPMLDGVRVRFGGGGMGDHRSVWVAESKGKKRRVSVHLGRSNSDCGVADVWVSASGLTHSKRFHFPHFPKRSSVLPALPWAKRGARLYWHDGRIAGYVQTPTLIGAVAPEPGGRHCFFREFLQVSVGREFDRRLHVCLDASGLDHRKWMGLPIDERRRKQRDELRKMLDAE